MAVKPSSWGADRLFARLDLPDSQYFPAITRQQAESMKTKYFTVRNAQNLYLGATKQVLAGDGVSSVRYAGYCSFAGELDKARRKLGAGDALALEAATLIAKWVARGLDQSVLEKVRYQVFDISAPVGP
ncbi:MAG: hypothetical protein R6X14_08830 [bacterium]